MNKRQEKRKMSASEKFSLRWNDFESSISSNIGKLRDAQDFLDVTLVCENDQIRAHKLVISACSPFFRNILNKNPHQNPLLYMKGVKLRDMESVLDFMYYGEVSIYQNDLNSSGTCPLTCWDNKKQQPKTPCR